MHEEINILDNPVIGNIKQWILIRGKNKLNPVLLLLQGGPDLPMISEADYFENKIGLEEYFTVVYWDQRGSGKSFNKKIPAGLMNMEQMVSDTNELTGYLKHKLNKSKIFIAGFSLGGTVALITASKYPENYLSVILAGPDIIMEEAEKYAYDFTVSEAVKRNNKRALNQLRKIGKPPHTDSKKFQTRVKWVVNFGGIQSGETYFTVFLKTLLNMIRCKYYTPGDIYRTIKGMKFSQENLLPKLIKLDLFELVKSVDTKLNILQGENDAVAPPELAEKYFNYIKAKEKVYYKFNNSAHMLHFEEPAKFREILINQLTQSTHPEPG